MNETPESIAKARIKSDFKMWAEGKSLDEIAEKVYEAMSTSYDLAKQNMLESVFEHFVKRPQKK